MPEWEDPDETSQHLKTIEFENMLAAIGVPFYKEYAAEMESVGNATRLLKGLKNRFAEPGRSSCCPAPAITLTNSTFISYALIPTIKAGSCRKRKFPEIYDILIGQN